MDGIRDGRIFTASDALGAGLVDELGYAEKAYEAAKQLAKCPDAKIIQYKRRMGLLDLLVTASTRKTEPSQLIKALAEEFQTPRLMYIWQPTP